VGEVCLPGIAQNLDGAISFGDFILSTSGKNILKDQGLNPIKPIIEGEVAKVLSSIRSLTEEENSTVLLSPE
jgi:molybdate/tungstate transport system substrate-binding protein